MNNGMTKTEVSERRAKIIKTVLDAGLTGIRCAELADRFNNSRKAVQSMLHRLAVHGAVECTGMGHGGVWGPPGIREDHWKRHGESRKALPARILAWLDAKPNGAHAADVAEAMACGKDVISRVLATQLRGKVDTVKDPGIGQGQGTRLRYYVKGRAPKAKAVVKTAKAGRPVKPVVTIAGALRSRPKVDVSDQPIIVPGNVKRTIAPTYIDTRFKVDAITEPCFSTMRFGEYLPAESALARAYAERVK